MSTAQRNSTSMNGHTAAFAPVKTVDGVMVDPPIAEWLAITPELAEQWLSRNTNNRPVRRTALYAYRSAILRNEWRVNGETIKFSRSGRLLDGQHRLKAIIEAGVEMVSLVVWMLDEDVFDTIDVGARRTAGDSLTVAAIGGGNATAAVIKKVLIYEQTGHFQTPYNDISSHQIVTAASSRPELVELAVTARKIQKRWKAISPSLFGSVFCILVDIDGDDAEAFMERLQSGVNLEADDPIYRARERLMSEKLAGRLGGRWEDEQTAIIFKAWNLWRDGKTTGLIKWSRSSPFPQPH